MHEIVLAPLDARRCRAAGRRCARMRPGDRGAACRAGPREDRRQSVLRDPVLDGAWRGGTASLRPRYGVVDLGHAAHPRQGLHRQRGRSHGREACASAAASQSALAQLACLGNSVDCRNHDRGARGTEAADRIAALDEAFGAGLVFRANGAYKFLHDRVQEAAYGSMPPKTNVADAPAHRPIAGGTDVPEPEFEDAIFDIVNHLNRGAALITTQEERERVVELNVMAGKRAKNSTAYAAARNYLAQAAGDASVRCVDATLRGYIRALSCALRMRISGRKFRSSRRDVRHDARQGPLRCRPRQGLQLAHQAVSSGGQI